MSLFSPFNRLAVPLLLLTAASVINPAHGEFVAQGGEYPITGPLNGDQVKPAVAIGSAGGYVVWQDNSVNARGSRLKVQKLSSTFTSEGEPLVVSSAARSKTAGDQENPQVALLGDTGAVFVWQGGPSGSQQIFARFIGPNGNFVKSDVRVASHPKNKQANPAVAALADGTAIIVWSSFGQDGSRQGIFGQRFSSTGSKLGKEFRVNTFTENNQRDPSIAALSDGGFVTAWISESQRSASGVDVYARLFDSKIIAPNAEFLVNSTTSNLCANPTVAASASGGFAVVWSQNDNVIQSIGTVTGAYVNQAGTARSSKSWDIFSRLFTADGTAVDASFQVNTYSYGDQYAPRVCSLGGDYFAVWTSLGEDGSWEGVFGRSFSSSGGLVGQPVRVNATTLSRQFQPAIASDGAASVLAIWSSFGVGTTFDFDLFAQKYLPSSGQ